MISVLGYLLVFIAGLITCDLIRIAQERRAIRHITRVIFHQAGPAEAALSEWSADPHNMCDRPGCPRCWGGWGRS
ncbi:hypothetical protein AB0B45_22300 [Nonomuraea sp. NPDC049152]|uniref:hypothetical protein n=1 Tax=Nonomuraea sp. NPDC049152 TaxID=3154350 RepID=UPI00340AB629